MENKKKLEEEKKWNIPNIKISERKEEENLEYFKKIFEQEAEISDSKKIFYKFFDIQNMKIDENNEKLLSCLVEKYKNVFKKLIDDRERLTLELCQLSNRFNKQVERNDLLLERIIELEKIIGGQ